MSRSCAVAYIWALIVSPCAPLAVAWFRVSRSTSRPVTPAPRVLLGLTTTSYLWFVATGIWPDTLAPHYSTLRYATIWLNMGTMLLLVVVGALRGDRLRAPLVWASALLVLVWLYDASISSVV